MGAEDEVADPAREFQVDVNPVVDDNDGSSPSLSSSSASEAGDIDVMSVDSEELEENIEECLSLRPADLTAEQSLAWWYSCLHPVSQDVNDELGGNESSLINGESLILRFACGLETGKTPEFLKKPRFIELMFRIEAFISQLNEVGFCNYKIVFFDCLKFTLLRRHPLLWCFRNLFLLHCIKNPEVFPYARFDNWYQDEYLQFFDTQKPFLMFLEDGSHLYLNESEIGKMARSDDSELAPGEHGLSPLYLLALNTVGRRTSVCFLYSLTRITRRIKAWSIGYESYSSTLELQVKETVLSQETAALCTLNESVGEGEDHEFFENYQCTSRFDFLSRVTAEIVADPDDEDSIWSTLYFKCLLLHDWLLRRLTLEQRNSLLRAIPSESYELTVEFMGFFMIRYFEELASKGQCSVPDSEIVDMYDELTQRRVLFHILSVWIKMGRPESLTQGDLGFGDEISYILTRWQEIYGSEFFPIRFSNIDDELEELGCSSGQPNWLCDVKPRTHGVSIPADNDFITQVIGDNLNEIMAQLPPSTNEEANELLDNFEETLEYSRGQDCQADDQQYSMFDTKPGNERYDFGALHVASNAKSVTQRPLPKFILRMPPDRMERAIKKWEMKVLQEGKKYVRDLNRFLGSLDRLHRPIVATSNTCSSDHPWFNESKATLHEEDTEKALTAAATRQKKKTDEKSSKPLLGSKAKQYIEKNKELKGEKIKKKDTDGLDQMMKECDYIFKKKVDSIPQFQGALLELLVGNRSAADTTVLESFNNVDKLIMMPENRLAYLTSVAQHLLEPLDTTWRYKSILAKGHEKNILKFIGLVFRFIQVTIDKYLHLMDGRQIEIFQSLLLTLGFVNSARVLFGKWAAIQWEKKISGKSSTEPTASLEEDQAKKKKAGKPGSGQGGKAKSKINSNPATSKDMSSGQVLDEAGLRQKASYIKKLESQHRIIKYQRSFDFAVRPEIEMTFQMEHLGADMTRSLGSIHDPRVPFLPDSWQKRLLDTVDASESALVVAPTSSGKTFICYYAMEQVLRYDNESCVVFVSPTRALALQVESEVLSRFGNKTYPSGNKTVLCGVLFDDRQQDWDNCQILVAVPSAFEAILSSKSPAIREWQNRLKYVIIDEVHCIGDEKIGRDCENLIQLLPCPFMTLSATVGNEADFNRWLTNAQPKLHKGTGKVTFIKYNERYADLKTLYYSSENRSLYSLNPILCVDYDRAKSGTLTGDFALVPPDCLQIFRVFAEVLKAKADDKTSPLSETDRSVINFFVPFWDPEVYFQDSLAITKKQYGRYAKSIAYTIESCVRSGVLNMEDYNEALRRIGQETPVTSASPAPWYKIPSNPKKTDEKSTEESAPLEQVLAVSGDNLAGFHNPEEFLDLIRNLEARKLLPALVFNFNRAFSSRLFYRLVNKLINDHRDKFYGTPELAAATRAANKQREDQYKQELQRREWAEKLKSLSKQQREEQGIDEQMLAELTGGSPPAPPIDVAEEHDSETFLCDKRTFMSSQEEYKEILRFCRIDSLVKNGRISPLLVEALRRGIGLYHDALHREYRRAVELLFRARYLRVVVSDISLSLGVNMPCKTTVFAGDSSSLTPLLFRQTAGRAGRRGFDSLGHIVFWDFPFKKIRRVLCSRLPVLSGKYPIRPASVLKTIKLAKVTDDAIIRSTTIKTEKDTQRLVRNIDRNRARYIKLLRASLFELGAPQHIFTNAEDFNSDYGISFAFSVSLLVRLGLLEASTGISMPGSSLVEAIPTIDQANLILPWMLFNGEFFASDLKNRLLRLYTLILERNEFTYSMVRKFELAKIPQAYPLLFPHAVSTNAIGTGSEWSPLIPPLPERMKSLLKKFDEIVLENAKDRIKVLVARLKQRQEYLEQDKLAELPLSKVSFPLSSDKIDIDAEDLRHWIAESTATDDVSAVQAPFFAGTADYDISSLQDLATRLPQDIFIDFSSIPQILGPCAEITHPITGEKKEDPLVNSYLLELVEHQSLRRIIQHNKIGASDAYFVAIAVREAVNHISAALESSTVRCDKALGDYSTQVIPCMNEIQTLFATIAKTIRK